MTMISRLPRSIPALTVPLRLSRTAVTVTSTRTNASAPLLANIEASWKDLPSEEQYQVYQQLGELQKKDWRELSIDEKKAGESGGETSSRNDGSDGSMGDDIYLSIGGGPIFGFGLRLPRTKSHGMWESHC